MERLLGRNEEETKELGGSLQEITQEALANPRVREMLQAFRQGGPESLAQFIDNPEYHASLDSIRGTFNLPSLPVAVAESITHPHEEEEKGLRIILGVSGSVAAVKAYELAIALSERLGAHVKIVPTYRGYWFMQQARKMGYDTQAIAAFDKAVVNKSNISIIQDQEEWQSWQQLGDDVLHIKLRDWADAIIIAPLSANCLAKIATGACDNLLTCILRAWDFSHAPNSQQTDLLGLMNTNNISKNKKKPIILAPAMNTAMWSHPFTSAQLDVCRRTLGAILVDPVTKTLACGDTGIGALAPVSAIIHATRMAM
eukprot:CAMPEP_0197298046 /NCGR_PEP_ID=MMETSP0890-20130614/42563_1 /TAXON_ID=44058 ORGANISM="Aureoumbra lagunensis, Strain CCMP1510" /NCGR_SAMPLE_ID=MMETSP0890 /ASSEMBLY_ACC=CAM_ASM_000533 /LENGTH=312 /DNA_ID=CAMNT_0042775537 /DNA_START=163 /DNA_END=1101 /DNA_ORIENTATION=+